MNEFFQTLGDSRRGVLELVSVLSNDDKVRGGNRVEGRRSCGDGEMKDFMVAKNDSRGAGK